MGTRRKLPNLLLFLPLALGALLVFFPRRGTTEGAPPTDVNLPPVTGAGLRPEELVFLLQYVGSDYAGAVKDGVVLDAYEYEEMLDFSRTLLEEHARLEPDPHSAVTKGLEHLKSCVEAKEDPVRILALTRELVSSMTRELALVTYPAHAPDLDNGARLYAVACAQCHGDGGDGHGRSAAGQDPPPTSFQGARMKAVAPHQLYNAIGFGVEGTAMPAYDAAYTPEQRWDVSFYLMTLRTDFGPEAPAKALSLTLRDLATQSDEELLAATGVSVSAIDYYREALPETPEDELLRTAQRTIEQSYRAFDEGDPSTAVRLSLEAYLEGIEPVESTLLAIDAELVRRIERELTTYRAAIRENAPKATVLSHLDRIRDLTDDARRTLAGSGSGFGFVFAQSTAIILREGIEAALLVALLLSYLTAAGQPELRRYTILGALAGIGVGLVTWFVAQYLIQTSTLEREALEGITSILAATVLFSVSFWIIQHADLKRWKSYIEGRAKSALGTGSGLALATVSFLAVYREAFETVLFYQALWLRHGGQDATAIVLGLAGGFIALAAVIVVMFRYGKRIPLKPFFAVTGILLGVLSLVFAGYGIAELQKIGWVQETPLSWVPYVPFLELQPTLEGLALQLGIFVSFVLSWFLAGESNGRSEMKPARAS